MVDRLDSVKCSPYCYIQNETFVDDNEDIYYFYEPRPLLKIDYDDNIRVIHDGKYSLPVLAYRAYRSAFGEDALRLYWVILEFSRLHSIRDLEIGMTLTFPSINNIKNIIR